MNDRSSPDIVTYINDVEMRELLSAKAAETIESLRTQLASARTALERIADLIDSEDGEPLDDAIRIASNALKEIQ